MFVSDKKTYQNSAFLSFLARFLKGGRGGFGFVVYMVSTIVFQKNFQKFQKNKNFKKKRKNKLSGCLYSDKLLYFLKFVVKFGLYCVKYVGVVVCTGVLIKVSCRQNFFFIRACMRTGVCDNDYIILICIILHIGGII